MDRRSLLKRGMALISGLSGGVLDEATAATVAQLEGELEALANDEQRELMGRRGWYDEDGVRQGGLIAFVRYFWPVLEPAAELVDGWPLWAICEHLEAVTFREIQHLLINVPPGFMKSMLTDVFWPAWEWGAMGKSSYRYICFSYAQSLTHRDNMKFRGLVTSPEYRALYNDVFAVTNETTKDIYNSKTGRKLALSVGGVTAGERGDRIILDDPHNTQDPESKVIREGTIQWFREALWDRVNNMNCAMVVIMQRLHEDDVSGVILHDDLPFVHLCIPMEFETNRETYTNGYGWSDPRHDPDNPNANAGELAFPERFDAGWVATNRRVKGPYAYASQYQQSPAPRGGGLFQRDWWRLWDHPQKKFPACDFVLVSVDGAFTEKEENDPTGCTVWGKFNWCKTCGRAVNDWQEPAHFDAHVCDCGPSRVALPRLILLDAWQKWLPFSGPKAERGERESSFAYQFRTQKYWGLLEWVAFTADTKKADLVLIEAKGPGISAAQQLTSHYGDRRWSVVTTAPKGDKVARALQAQPIFSQGLVFAPERDWAEMVMLEMANFPKGRHDDLCDATTQAVNWFRNNWYAQTDEEVTSARYRGAMHKSKRRPIYPV